jgi:IS30 family transposase
MRMLHGNGLIRRVYPKKTDLSLVTEEALRTLEYQLNTRPRKRHGGFTPEEVFFKATGVALYSKNITPCLQAGASSYNTG